MLYNYSTLKKEQFQGIIKSQDYHKINTRRCMYTSDNNCKLKVKNIPILRGWKRTQSVRWAFFLLWPNPFSWLSLLLLPLKCCLRHWKWWDRLWLPAQRQTPAVSADVHDGAFCKPAQILQTAEPERPLGQVRRELMSPHDIELAHLLGLWVKVKKRYV